MDMGINPIIAFKIRGNVGHSVLVSDIVEKDDHYVLNVIDPNMSYQKGIYKFSKKTSKLSTVFYGDVDIILPRINLARELGISNILKIRKLRKIAINTAKELGIYTFSPSSFYK